MRVKRVTLTVRRSLPVFPNKRTFSELVGMSQTCQQATYRHEKCLCGCGASSHRARPRGRSMNAARCVLNLTFRGVGLTWGQARYMRITDWPSFGLGAVREVVGIGRGAFSGNMKVSFQAARSIG
jgi:hypothetical protein